MYVCNHLSMFTKYGVKLNAYVITEISRSLGDRSFRVNCYSRNSKVLPCVTVKIKRNVIPFRSELGVRVKRKTVCCDTHVHVSPFTCLSISICRHSVLTNLRSLTIS